MPQPPSEASLKPFNLNDLGSEIAETSIKGRHEREVRHLRCRFLPELRRLAEEGHELSDCVVCIIAFDSGVYFDEIRVAGEDGNFLGPDKLPARGKDGKHLWPMLPIRVRPKAYWLEYFAKYKNEDGTNTYQVLMTQMMETPPEDEAGLEGYWVVVAYAGAITISASHWPTDHPLMPWEIDVQKKDGVVPNPVFVPKAKPPAPIPHALGGPAPVVPESPRE